MHPRGIIPARAGFTTTPGRPSASAGDHPRSRGVYPGNPNVPGTLLGSSPLARGLQPAPGRSWARGGIIPARAGFTLPKIPRPKIIEDHPRSRGVYRQAEPGRGPPSGSSPLARGLLLGQLPGAGEHRIIPARAGFTGLTLRRRTPPADHPRSRGVYVVAVPRWATSAGSSPLARGLRLMASPAHAGRRIIPARAGFTLSAVVREQRRGDHPRSRGVYLDSSEVLNSMVGSSPLARGLLETTTDPEDCRGIIPARAGFTPNDVKVTPLLRIIPARAGFTGRRSSTTWRAPDHPRSRGVYPSSITASRRTVGSSPLARGLPAHRLAPSVVSRIIPARAGFTNLFATTPRRGADHPRSRGVYAPRVPSEGGCLGSSPLARGLRSALGVATRRFRIIPARAGFTR